MASSAPSFLVPVRLPQALGPVKAMTLQAPSFVAYANFAVAAGLGIWCLYLISMPLHPAAGDSHGGLLSVFAGLLLAPVPLAVFTAGWLFQRQSKAAWLMQVVASGMLAALVLALVP